MYARFESQHAYARRNGYKGTYDEYVANLYKGYREICKRNDIKPLSKDTWFAQQSA